VYLTNALQPLVDVWIPPAELPLVIVPPTPLVSHTAHALPAMSVSIARLALLVMVVSIPIANRNVHQRACTEYVWQEDASVQETTKEKPVTPVLPDLQESTVTRVPTAILVMYVTNTPRTPIGELPRSSLKLLGSLSSLPSLLLVLSGTGATAVLELGTGLCLGSALMTKMILVTTSPTTTTDLWMMKKFPQAMSMKKMITHAWTSHKVLEPLIQPQNLFLATLHAC